MSEITSGATDTIRMLGYVLEPPVRGQKIVCFRKESDPNKCRMLVTKSFEIKVSDITMLDTHVWSVWSAETNGTYILQLIKEDISDEKLIIGNIIGYPRKGSAIEVLAWMTCSYGLKCEILKVQVEQLSVLSETIFNIGGRYLVETI